MVEKVRLALEGKFALSGEAAGVEEFLRQFFERANESILAKGAEEEPEEGSRIAEWRLEGSTLLLRLESGARVRATSGVLRLRKALAEELGECFRIGIRQIGVERLAAEFYFERALTTEVVEAASRVVGVAKAAAEGNVLKVELKPLSYSDLKRSVPDRILNFVRRRAEAALAAAVMPQVVKVEKVLKQSPPKPIKFDRDVMEAALELGWIKQFPGRGQWIYTPPYAALLEVIEGLLLEEVVSKLGFEPCMLPKLIPLDVMKLMPGYLDGIPEGMYYVCPPPRDPAMFERFKQEFKVRKEVPREELKKVLKLPDYVLAPAQCEPFWYLFSHEVLSLEDLPIKLYDCSGWTYRWEGGGVEGLVRLHEFRRIELVYLGSPDHVVDIRESILEESASLADALDLEWRVVPGIPFFARGVEVEEDVTRRDVAALDLEVYLPYRGPREVAEWLEVTSCFVHKDKFVKAFSIREAKGRELWCGCSGIGVSRWTAAFLARHGFNPDDWPEVVRRWYRACKVPKMLTWPKRHV